MSARVLWCITVYNGRAFVPSAIESATNLDRGDAELDILVLDDCSPEPGWSEELAEICQKLGVAYYRSPRNIGIPRNFSLAMRTATEEGYDYVVVSNSDVVYAHNTLVEMLACFNEPMISSVTAWSTNASIYSVRNTDPDTFVSTQPDVDLVANCLQDRFHGMTLSIPTAIGFCFMIPTAVVRDVGLMDPVFGRGYCEETDWSLRSRQRGYKISLALGTFVYHAGGGTNLEEGILAAGMSTVPENERIIDMRYPDFRDEVADFVAQGDLEEVKQLAERDIVIGAGRSNGYTIEVGWLPRRTKGVDRVRCLVAPEGKPIVRLDYRGFRHEFEVTSVPEIGKKLREMFMSEPAEINLYDRGGVARDLLAAESSLTASDQYAYPTRV